MAVVPDFFKDLVWDSLVNAAKTKLFAAFPILAWGPVGIITNYVILKYADQLYDFVKEFVDVSLIKIKNEQFQREYDRASVSLKILARTAALDSDEFKEARHAHRKALSKFANFDVARTG